MALVVYHNMIALGRSATIRVTLDVMPPPLGEVFHGIAAGGTNAPLLCELLLLLLRREDALWVSL